VSQLSNFWAELRVIWDLLDDVAVPAPSHRNRTITQWAETMESAKRRLMALRNQAVAVDTQIAEIRTQAEEMAAVLNSIPFDAIAALYALDSRNGGSEDGETVNAWLRSSGYWKTMGYE
jgi:hypothetical protein